MVSSLAGEKFQTEHFHHHYVYSVIHGEQTLLRELNKSLFSVIRGGCLKRDTSPILTVLFSLFQEMKMTSWKHTLT